MPHYRTHGDYRRAQAKKRNQITRIYTRLYRDSGQTKAYVDWSDGSRTEDDAEDYHGILLPVSAHMGGLFDRALNEGLSVENEVW